MNDASKVICLFNQISRNLKKKSKFLETHRHLANISNVNDCQSGFVLPFCNIDLQLWLSVCQKTVLAIKGT